MRRRPPHAGFAAAVAAIGVAICLASAVLLFVGRDSKLPGILSTGGYAFDILFALLFATWPVMGAIVTARVPGNAVGPLLLAMGISGPMVQLVEALGSVLALTDVSSREVILVIWLGTWIWVPPIVLIGAILGIVPHGRLVSPSWRPWFFGAGGVGLLQSTYAFLPGALPQVGVPNPFGIDSPLIPAAGFVGTVGIAVFMLVAAGSLLVRFRRSRGVERQQLKWIASAGVVVAVFIPVASLLYGSDPAITNVVSVVTALAVATFPVVIGLAVLRYRLYDIDVVIRRTVVYGTLSAAIAATYVGLVVLLQSALRPLTGGSEISVAGSTLAALALVQPLRRRIQDAVDLRFYRSRYDAARTLDAFSARLRDEVDLDRLRHELLGVVGATLRPTHAGVWLRER